MSSVPGPGRGARGISNRLGPLLDSEIARHPYIRTTAGLVALTGAIFIARLFLSPQRELNLTGYALLHTLLETCSIFVCLLVFMAAASTESSRRNRNMVLVGSAFLGVALLDFLHAQSYAGMPAFVTPASPEKAINFWLAARLLAALALLVAACMPWDRQVPDSRIRHVTIAVLGAVAAISWVILYRPHWVPPTYIAGQGLTTFKVVVEYVVIVLNLMAAYGFYRISTRRAENATAPVRFDPIALMSASIVTALAELLFTIYTDVDGLVNFAGHVYKVIGAWFLCRGLVVTSLFEIEARSRLALEAAQLGTWTWDVGTDRLECSATAAAIWGLSTDLPTTMQAIDDLVHPDDRTTRASAIRRGLDPAGGGQYSIEYRIVRPGDQSIAHVVSHGRTEFRDGRAHRVVAIVQDVTARRHSDGAVRQSEARLSGILAIAADAIVTIDEQHRITLFNQGAETTFGYAKDEVIGRPLELLLPERFRKAHPAHIRTFEVSSSAARRMGERGEIIGRRKDGREFPAEASISKLSMDGRTTFTVVLRDITDRKRIETELERRVAERTAELSALVDALPDGIVLADLDHRLRTSNAAMTRLFGHSRQQIEDMPASGLYASLSDRETVEQAWREWERGDRPAAVSVECRRRDGTTFPAMVLGTVVRDDVGRPRARVAIIRDITEDVKRQRALSQAQRMEAFGQLTGGIAHDFNNLLTVISGNQELLEMRLKDPRDLALLRRSQEAASMGARLTARLLTFARRRQLEPAVLDLNEQITTLVELLQRSIGEQITLTTNLAPRLWKVRADPSEIENALLNLAINARDAMPSGGTLTIETAECVVGEGEIGTDDKLPAGDYVLLSVRDTGVGMTPEVRARAMEPFFTTKPTGKGTGLGLSTLYGFVRQSGGTVTLQSEVGKGTSISIYLPRALEAVRPAADNDAGLVPRGRPGETVLVVEDDARVRETTVTHVARLGYGVVEAENAVAAIELLARSTAGITLVFSDVVMPGNVSGFDLARWVGEHAPHLKLLLTSGYPDQVAGTSAGASGSVKLLRKPFSHSELARALRTALDG